ncbi:MAG TPA: hypothetical protein VIX82_08530 [Solirubrobacteraceae bacterium]
MLARIAVRLVTGRIGFLLAAIADLLAFALASARAAARRRIAS